MIEKKFKEIKNKYRKTRKIQCPAFNNEPIILGTHFWTHIKFNKNKRKRTNSVILSKLNSIKAMIDITKNITYFQDTHIGKDKNTIMHFWTIIAMVDGTRYGIIIRKKGKQGNKHFYSIIPNYKGSIPRKES